MVICVGLVCCCDFRWSSATPMGLLTFFSVLSGCCARARAVPAKKINIASRGERSRQSSDLAETTLTAARGTDPWISGTGLFRGYIKLMGRLENWAAGDESQA